MTGSIGLLRETRHLDEKRVVLTPAHVERLVKDHGVEVLVQPSTTRVYKDEEYEKAGATVTEDLSRCNVLFGVKEVNEKRLLANKTYLFFSHTVKGQAYNMPLLKRILEQRITLIDYELVKQENGRRILFFGHYAGYAGMINALWTLGKRLSWEGLENPFTTVRQTKEYDDLTSAKQELKKLGRHIKKEGLPNSLVPLVIGYTGFGRVSKGAQEIIKLFPTHKLTAAELPEFFSNGRYNNGVIYTVEFKKNDLFMKQDGAGFDNYFYNKYPERFTSKLETYLSYLTLLVNGIYWEPRYPRLVTKSYLRQCYEGNPNPRLRVIADISCDVEGSIEMTTKTTTSEDPCYVYEPLTGNVKDGIAGVGPVIIAQDKLPIELPREASTSFGNALERYAPLLAKTDYRKTRLELGLPKELKKAVIAHHGELAKRYEHLHAYIKDVE